MVSYQIEGPREVARWPKPICTFVEAPLPGDALRWESHPWNERLFEASLLHQPHVLTQALGIPRGQRLLVLKQVHRIDFYVRSENSLHLVEVKKPSGHRLWRVAADEVARQWARGAHWLRQADEPVFLWAVAPVKWSRSRGVPKVPEDWARDLERIRLERLTGAAAAGLGLLFYTVFRSAGGLWLVLWRADEPPPTIRLETAADVIPPSADAADGAAASAATDREASMAAANRPKPLLGT